MSNIECKWMRYYYVTSKDGKGTVFLGTAEEKKQCKGSLRAFTSLSI
jgi:hypothetical protein